MSSPVPYHGPAELGDAKSQAVRLVETHAERFGYKVTGEPLCEVSGDEEGGHVVARAEAHPVRRSW